MTARKTTTRKAAPKTPPAKAKPVEAGVRLSQLEREAFTDEPFYIYLEELDEDGNEVRLEMKDPEELPFTALASRNPLHMLAEALGDEGYERFIAEDPPGWKVGEIVRLYKEHFGVGSQGELNA